MSGETWGVNMMDSEENLLFFFVKAPPPCLVGLPTVPVVLFDWRAGDFVWAGWDGVDGTAIVGCIIPTCGSCCCCWALAACCCNWATCCIICCSCCRTCNCNISWFNAIFGATPSGLFVEGTDPLFILALPRSWPWGTDCDTLLGSWADWAGTWDWTFRLTCTCWASLVCLFPPGFPRQITRDFPDRSGPG